MGHLSMYAYPPIYEAAWPATPIWHPPAEVLEVVYPAPGPYARRKDSRRGSLAMAALSAPMMSMGFYGAESAPPAAAPASAPAPQKQKPSAKSSPKPVGKQIKAFFTKDESGKSKAGKVAERAMELAAGKKAEAAPAPAPIVIQAPAASAAAGVSPLQLALIGLVALGVGAGAGYAFGRSR